MSDSAFNTDPSSPYNGPDFEEYCIREGKYLSAQRDRTPCIACPLSNLCQAGFEEQVMRVVRGENPSLTEGCSIDPRRLERDQLLSGLTPEQQEFVLSNIPNM